MNLLLIALTLSSAPQTVTETVEGPAGRLGAGGRLTWSQSPMSDPRLWIDGQVVVRPIPRILLTGTWGRSEESRRGLGMDTTISEMRWDLGVGAVILQGAGADVYIPGIWRHASQRHSRLGDASWTEFGVGLGALAPLKGTFSLRSELMWVSPSSPHRNLLLGPGRESDGSRFELSLGFVAFVN